MFEPQWGLSFAARNNYEIIPAFSDALKDEVYRIRHQVYCEELAYEPQRADRREYDEYDAQSLHLLIRDVHNGEFTGCTRLVRVRAEDPYYPLPFEKMCASTLDRSIVDPAKLPRDTIGEISRLALLSQFRRRKGEEKCEGAFSQDIRPLTNLHFPRVLTDLTLGIIALARASGIDTLFVLTEARLARHLRTLGFNFQAIGAPIEHRGQRLPSMMNDFHCNVRPLHQIPAMGWPHAGLGASAALRH